MTRERYPENKWSASWKCQSLLNHQLNQYVSSVMLGNNIRSTTQQKHTSDNEHKPKWGKSFRLANPVPNIEKPWLESSPNPCCYTVLWSVEKIIQNKINTNFSNNPTTLRLWRNSHEFLQGDGAQMKDTSQSKEPMDPGLIIPKKIKTRKHLFSNNKKEKLSQKKWTGWRIFVVDFCLLSFLANMTKKVKTVKSMTNTCCNFSRNVSTHN